MTSADLGKKIIEIMERLHFFDAFSPLEKRKIVALHANFGVYRAGDTIVKEGSKGTTMFVLLSGSVKVSKGCDPRAGIELKPGDIFGEMGFLTSTYRTADVTAENTVIALELDKKILLELDTPIREKIKDKIIEKLIQRLDHMNNALFKLNSDGESKLSSHPAFLNSKAPDSGARKVEIGPHYGLPADDDSAGNISLKQIILKNVKELPPMPDILLKAQKILADPASGPQELARVLATDQAIVARILKVANSAYYGFPGKIGSIEKASALFGTDRLNQLLTTMSISTLPKKLLKGYEMKSTDLWQHALATACSAKRVAENTFPEMAEDAYIAGLLHDSGKFLLDPCVMDRKAQFKKAVTVGNGNFLAAEREILGFDHAEIAYAVCSKWNIPEGIARAIRFHHRPTHPKGNLLAHLTHYANHLAIQTRIGACKDSLSLKLNRTTKKIFERTEPELNSLLDAIKNDVNSAARAVQA